MIRLPEVDRKFFKKNKRRRGLLICLSFAILWFLTIAAISSPCISCSEDSIGDVNPSEGYANDSQKIRHLVALPVVGLTESSDSLLLLNRPINAKIPRRYEKPRTHFRIRKQDAYKRWHRFRRDVEGSADSSREPTETNTATISEFGDINNLTTKKKKPTIATTLYPSSTFLNSTTNDGQTSTLNDTQATNYDPTESTNTITTTIETTTTTTTITTPSTTTTTRDPCRDVVDVAPTNLRFPSKNLKSNWMNVRFSVEKNPTIPVKYSVSIYHNGGRIDQQYVDYNKSRHVINVTNLLPCNHYNACVVVVPLFKVCPESNRTRVCSDTTTATEDIRSNKIQHRVLNIDSTFATIQFDRFNTSCETNYTLDVNGSIWKFHGADFISTPISTNKSQPDINVTCDFTASSSKSSCELSDLTPYTSYHVQVWASNAVYDTKKVCIKIKTKPSRPTKVRNCNATCFTNSANISWEVPEVLNGEFEHYKVEVKKCWIMNRSKCDHLESFNLSISNFNYNSAEPGYAYRFRIRAKTVNVSEYGQFSETYCDTKPLETAKPESDENVILVVVAWILTFLLLLVLLGFLLIALQRKKIIKLPFNDKWCQRRSQNSIDIPCKVTSKPVQLMDFEGHYQNMTADSFFKFSQEFEELVSGSPSYPTTAAQLNENRPKNRWINILPFDHSRVKLLPIADDVFTDYINASYIPGYKSLREFIASQGPLPNTKDDFWRMVWEQNSPMIVMVTQCIERGKEKCEQYWPEDRETHYYGDLAVNLKSESILTGYTLRIFDLHLKERMTTAPTAIDLSDLLELIPRYPEIEKGSRTMEVKHMHFTMWPDFGCPENTSLLINFVQSMRDHMPHNFTGPIIVHCSAGVGRTGTFIAVDKLMQHIEEHDFVDIFGTVREMRNYRTNMVQTEDQYMYIHECIKDLLIEMQNRTPISKNSGESMIDILGMAKSDTPSRNRRTESSLCDSDVTETTVLLSVATGASDLTDIVFSELTDTVSVLSLSEHAISESEAHGNADNFDSEFGRESQKFPLPATNRMSHDPNERLSHFAVDKELPWLQPTKTTQAGDSADIPLASLTDAVLETGSDTWYF